MGRDGECGVAAAMEQAGPRGPRQVTCPSCTSISSRSCSICPRQSKARRKHLGGARLLDLSSKIEQSIRDRVKRGENRSSEAWRQRLSNGAKDSAILRNSHPTEPRSAVGMRSLSDFY